MSSELSGDMAHDKRLLFCHMIVNHLFTEIHSSVIYLLERGLP